MDEFSKQVRLLLDQARDSLGRIEIEVREKEETPALMEASRTYAQYCLHAREFLFGFESRRPLPRRLAERVEPLAATLERLWPQLERHGLAPDAGQLRALQVSARSLHA